MEHDEPVICAPRPKAAYEAPRLDEQPGYVQTTGFSFPFGGAAEESAGAE